MEPSYTLAYRQNVSTSSLWIRLLTRGYIANFTLLDFRTTRYSTERNKWLDESDDVHFNNRKCFSQQIWYYGVALILNFVMVFSWYKLENPLGYFACIGPRGPFVGLILLGAPLSLLLTIIFDSVRNHSLFSSLSLTALEVVHTQLKDYVIEKDYTSFMSLLGVFTEPDADRLLRVKSRHGDEHYDIIDHVYKCKEFSSNDERARIKEDTRNFILQWISGEKNMQTELPVNFFKKLNDAVKEEIIQSELGRLKVRVGNVTSSLQDYMLSRSWKSLSTALKNKLPMPRLLLISTGTYDISNLQKLDDATTQVIRL